MGFATQSPKLIQNDFGDGSSGPGNSSNAANLTSKAKQGIRKMIKIHYTNGDIYEGQVNKDNHRDGNGVYMTADKKRMTGYEYQGPWKDNLKEGKNGKCFYYNEEFYIGDWQQDQRHGQGDHFYKYNEERYIGDWRYDMRHGKGTLIWVQNSSGGSGHHHYEGRFKQDRRNGRGILKFI